MLRGAFLSLFNGFNYDYFGSDDGPQKMLLIALALKIVSDKN